MGYIKVSECKLCGDPIYEMSITEVKELTPLNYIETPYIYFTCECRHPPLPKEYRKVLDNLLGSANKNE